MEAAACRNGPHRRFAQRNVNLIGLIGDAVLLDFGSQTSTSSSWDSIAELSVIHARVERILHGESVDAAEALEPAGSIPAYYGPDATTQDVAAKWLRMASTCREQDEAFYLAGAIGWSSR